MSKFDIAETYITDELDFNDLGSLIAYAMIEGKGNFKEIAEFLNGATTKLLPSERTQQLNEVLSGAIYALDTWADSQGL